MTCPRLFGQIESRLPAASEPFVGFFRYIETEMFFFKNCRLRQRLIRFNISVEINFRHRSSGLRGNPP